MAGLRKHLPLPPPRTTRHPIYRPLGPHPFFFPPPSAARLSTSPLLPTLLPAKARTTPFPPPPPSRSPRTSLVGGPVLASRLHACRLHQHAHQGGASAGRTMWLGAGGGRAAAPGNGMRRPCGAVCSKGVAATQLPGVKGVQAGLVPAGCMQQPWSHPLAVAWHPSSGGEHKQPCSTPPDTALHHSTSPSPPPSPPHLDGQPLRRS